MFKLWAAYDACIAAEDQSLVTLSCYIALERLTSLRSASLSKSPHQGPQGPGEVWCPSGTTTYGLDSLMLWVPSGPPAWLPAGGDRERCWGGGGGGAQNWASSEAVYCPGKLYGQDSTFELVRSCFHTYGATDDIVRRCHWDRTAKLAKYATIKERVIGKVLKGLLPVDSTDLLFLAGQLFQGWIREVTAPPKRQALCATAATSGSQWSNRGMQYLHLTSCTGSSMVRTVWHWAAKITNVSYVIIKIWAFFQSKPRTWRRQPNYLSV